MWIKSLSAGLLFLVLLGSCEPERILPASSGAAGELVIVMAETHWEGEMGKGVKAMFGRPVLGLPQRESRFTLLHYTPTNFPKLLRTHRNILLADVGPEFSDVGVRPLYENWARKQQVVQLTAPDTVAWLSLLNKEGAALMALFDESERARIQDIQRSTADPGSAQMLADEFGIRLTIPSDFELAKNKQDFKHFRRDRVITSKSRDGDGFSKMGHQVIDGIFVYKYPYTSDSTFTRPELMNMRDSSIESITCAGSNRSCLYEHPAVFRRPGSKTRLFNHQCRLHLRHRDARAVGYGERENGRAFCECLFR